MQKIVIDIETKNEFKDVGSAEPTALDISLVGLYDSATSSYLSFLEKDFSKLWPILESADILIGYNSDHFDIPLLNKYYHGNLKSIKSIDILNEIRKSIGRRVKLDQVAEGTLGKKKSGHGLEAIRWWKTGEMEKIRQYCLEDVKLTKEIYDYALLNGELKFREGNKNIPIAMDTSRWETQELKNTTSSLPF